MYYGWIMLPIAMTAFVATSPGQTFGVSIFNEPIRRALELSHGQLAAAYTFGTLAASIPLAYVGVLMDRHGLRRTMTVVVALLGIACLMTSQAGNWFMLFCGFLLLRLLGPGALTLLSSNTLANWFHRRLGMVEGIRHVGMATAMAVIPAVHLGLLESFGWRGADIVLGLLIWAVMLPLMLLAYRERPEDVGQRLDGDAPEPAGDQSAGTTPVDSAIPLLDLTFQQALRTPSFWIVACGTSTFGIVHTAIFFCIVPIFLDRGLTETHATAMLTVFAMSLAVMQFVGGLLADRVRPTLLMPFAMGGLTVSVLLLVRMSHPAMGLAAGIGLGVSQGLFFAASNPLWARYFGRLQLGRIRGTVSTMNIGSSSLGPLLCGVCRDLLGSYQPVLVLFALLPLPLIVMCCWASPPLSPDGNESPAS